MTAIANAACPWRRRRRGNWPMLCPVCGKPLTLGVLHRVEDLADVNAESPRPFSYQMPLRQILAQVLHCGENSKKVSRRYFELIERLGPEFSILQHLPDPGARRSR